MVPAMMTVLEVSGFEYFGPSKDCLDVVVYYPSQIPLRN